MENKELFDEYFDSVFKLSNKFTESEYAQKCREYDMLYKEFMPADKSAQILDIGCGAGHFLYFLNKKGYIDIQGIDISAQQIDFCRKKISEKVTQADAFDFLADKKEIYDVISSHDVLEHIPKEKVIPFLRLVYAGLKPGGVFFAKTPNMGNLFSLRLRYADFTHQVGFTEKSLRQVFWIAGFRDIRILPSYDHGLRQKVAAAIIRFFICKLMWYQGYVAPEILTPVLIAVVKK